MRERLKAIILCIFSISLLSNAACQYDVRKSGATGNGTTLDTRSIQLAIDQAYGNGGGIVNVPSGTYKTGTLILKDNVNLNLENGAVLLGSPDTRDYDEIIQKYESRTNGLYAKYFMVYAEGAKNISITGLGTISGNGLNNFLKVDPQNMRPFMIRLVNCDNVTIRDVHLIESANWTLHLLGCHGVNIDGVVIENEVDYNRDGLDIDCCRGVTVSNSRFSTGDDAIVMKSSSDVVCQDIAITNCFITTRASAIKTGTESNGGFKNITVSNCIIKDLPVHTAIELMTVDGGMLQNILLDNIAMENVATPIFIRLGLRARPFKSGQYVNRIEGAENICLNNISVLNARLPSSIMGLNSIKIKNVTISNYTVRNSESQKPSSYNNIPFEEFSYPMAIMFKNLPAYGLYCRNVEELHLQNLFMDSPDGESRPAMAFDRINEIELFSVKAKVNKLTTAMIHFRNVKNVSASFCRSVGENDLLFESEESSEKINLSNNILQTGQNEMNKVASLPDSQFFEDFRTDIKYSVDQGEIIKGLPAHNLRKGPLKFMVDITKRGSLQLCLLTLNDSSIPGKIQVRYEGMTQEFTINWKEWGWAPITLLKEYSHDRKVEFEISAAEPGNNLIIAKAYFRYQDVGKTD